MTELLPLIVPPLAMLVMAIVGLGLAPADFTRLRAEPARVPGVMLLQWGAALAVALLVARSPLASPAGSVGLVLLAASPVAPLASFYARLAGGPVALSVSVTVLSSLAATVVTPATAALGLATLPDRAADVPLPLASLVQQVLLVLTLPLVAGMLARWRAPHWVAAQQGVFSGIGIAAVAALVGGVLADQWSTLRGALAGHALLALVYTLGVALLALLAAVAWPAPAAGWRALAWGFAARNTAIAAVLALTALGDPAVVGFLAVLMVVQAPLLMLLAVWSGRRAPA